MGKDGTIYVADTGNHCIRAISPTGTVSVYAGSPTASGSTTGTRLQARFTQPMGLAIDPDGSLLIADPEIGLRKIDSTGTVTALPFGNRPFGVSSAGTINRSVIYVADADGILEIIQGKEIWRLRSTNQPSAGVTKPVANERKIAMDAPIGYPISVTQIDDNVFYGDIRTNAVRYAYPDQMLAKILAGPTAEDFFGGKRRVQGR